MAKISPKRLVTGPSHAPVDARHIGERVLYRQPPATAKKVGKALTSSFATKTWEWDSVLWGGNDGSQVMRLSSMRLVVDEEGGYTFDAIADVFVDDVVWSYQFDFESPRNSLLVRFGRYTPSPLSGKSYIPGDEVLPLEDSLIHFHLKRGSHRIELNSRTWLNLWPFCSPHLRYDFNRLNAVIARGSGYFTQG